MDIFKIAHILEMYLIFIALVSFISTYLYDFVSAFTIMILLFLGPLMLILFPIIVISHIIILGERLYLIFEKKDAYKNEIHMLNIFCIFGSISIVYVLWLFSFVASTF